MPLWSWPVPTCCWEVRSWRELFQLSVMLKCWCASWRSALRHHYRHYAWLRKTKVSECQITLCDGTYGGKWWHTVYSGKVTLRYNSVSSVCVERSANQIGIDRRQKKKCRFGLRLMPAFLSFKVFLLKFSTHVGTVWGYTKFAPRWKRGLWSVWISGFRVDPRSDRVRKCIRKSIRNGHFYNIIHFSARHLCTHYIRNPYISARVRLYTVLLSSSILIEQPCLAHSSLAALSELTHWLAWHFTINKHKDTFKIHSPTLHAVPGSIKTCYIWKVQFISNNIHLFKYTHFAARTLYLIQTKQGALKITEGLPFSWVMIVCIGCSMARVCRV